MQVGTGRPGRDGREGRRQQDEEQVGHAVPAERDGAAAWRGGGWRQARRRPPCPHPNPGRYETGGRLVQGMRVAFSGDTSIDREVLEDQAFEAGLHIASSVSRLTSLLVTNDPDALTSKVAKARTFGTPVLDEAAFTQLLRDVAPAPGTAPGSLPGALPNEAAPGTGG